MKLLPEDTFCPIKTGVNRYCHGGLHDVTPKIGVELGVIYLKCDRCNQTSIVSVNKERLSQTCLNKKGKKI